MGSKYLIYGFNYPYEGMMVTIKQTKFFLVALFWFAIGSLKYDGVNVLVRR